MSFTRLVRPALALALGAGLFAADYTVDPVHTTTLFQINHLGVSNFIGRFDKVSGTISFDAADASKDSVKFTIDADSVDTAFTKRDDHLKSPDFLDAKQFATIEFVSTGFKKTGEKEYEVTGNVTMHGQTKPLTAKVVYVGEGKDPAGAQRIGFETRFDLKRSEFGMDKMIPMIGDDIHVILTTEGVAK
jgi:polyisoprenoid-binding protein YceI